MIKSLKDFILNKRNIILFWLSYCIIEHFVTRIFLAETLRATLWRAFWFIDILWSIIILFDDIRHNRIDIKDKKKLLLVIFVGFTAVSWVIKAPVHNVYYLCTLITLFEQAFIFYRFGLESNIDEIKKIINIIAYMFGGLVFLYTASSLLFYVLGYDEVTFMDGTVIHMYSVENSLSHSTRYMGIWSWCTTASFDCYLAILLHLYLIDNKSNKLVHIASIILNSIMIYLADSRTSLMILAVITFSYVFFLMLKKKGKAKTVKYSKIFIVVMIVVTVIYLMTFKSDTLALFIHSPEETLQGLTTGRFYMAKGILETIKGDLLLGKGYANNDFILNKYGIVHPHNLFLALLFYTGIPGLVLFISFLVLNMISMRSKFRFLLANNLKWIFVLVVCVFIESIFDISIIGASPLNIQTFFFWLSLGIVSNEQLKNNL